MTAPTVDTPTVPPAADAAGKNAEPATNATPDKTEVGVPTAKLLQDVSSALLLARRDISVLESQLLAGRREVEALRETLRYFVECHSIQGTADSERYDRAIALLNRAAATPEEK